VEAGEAAFQLAGEAGGGALNADIVLGRNDHGDLGRLFPVGTGQSAGGK
jgi:hypothetical protein